MRRKSVRQLLESIGKLRKTVHLERGRISRRLAGRLAAPPAVAPAYGPVLKHMEDELAALVTDLATAEDRYVAAKEHLREVRRRRDAAVAALRGPLQSLLRLLTSLSETWNFAVNGSVPPDPQGLVEEAPLIIDLLRRLERDPPPPVLGVSLDAGVAAADLEAARDRLKGVLAELAEAESGAVATRQQADAAMAHTKNVAPWVIQAIEGLAGLAAQKSRAPKG